MQVEREGINKDCKWCQEDGTLGALHLKYNCPMWGLEHQFQTI